MKKILKWLALALSLFLIALSVILYTRYGGGQEYTYVPAEPFLGKEQVYEFFSYDEPIGNVAATPDTASTRVFFTIHPESRPERYKLCEIIAGEAVPYPAESQHLYITPLGLFADRQNRLWVIDHGASLYFHHGWAGGIGDPARFASQPWRADDHVLRAAARTLPAADALTRDRLDRQAFTEALDAVPDEWFEAVPGAESASAQRAAYVDFLSARLASRQWLEGVAR